MHSPSRISTRWRSRSPGSWALVWCRWSQSVTGIGSRSTVRSGPCAAGRSRQVPYSLGGPVCSPGGPVLGVVLALGRERRVGRAHPWAVGWPCWSVTVTHQVVAGLAAAAVAIARAMSASRGPKPGASPGWSARPSRVARGIVRLIRAAGPVLPAGPALIGGRAAFPHRTVVPAPAVPGRAAPAGVPAPGRPAPRPGWGRWLRRRSRLFPMPTGPDHGWAAQARPAGRGCLYRGGR